LLDLPKPSVRVNRPQSKEKHPGLPQRPKTTSDLSEGCVRLGEEETRESWSCVEDIVVVIEGAGGCEGVPVIVGVGFVSVDIVVVVAAMVDGEAALLTCRVGGNGGKFCIGGVELALKVEAGVGNEDGLVVLDAFGTSSLEFSQKLFVWRDNLGGEGNRSELGRGVFRGIA
jgi:hypothetical protein